MPFEVWHSETLNLLGSYDTEGDLKTGTDKFKERYGESEWQKIFVITTGDDAEVVQKETESVSKSFEWELWDTDSGNRIGYYTSENDLLLQLDDLIFAQPDQLKGLGLGRYTVGSEEFVKYEEEGISLYLQYLNAKNVPHVIEVPVENSIVILENPSFLTRIWRKITSWL